MYYIYITCNISNIFQALVQKVRPPNKRSINGKGTFFHLKRFLYLFVFYFEQIDTQL